MKRVSVIPLVLAVTAFAAPVPKEIQKVNDDRDIIGTWQMVVHTNNGTPTNVADVCWQFATNGKAYIYHHSTGNLTPMTFSIDPGATPKTMEWSNGGNRASIYKLEGDRLWITSTMTLNGPRPTTFEGGNSIYYTEFKRIPDPVKK